MLKKKDVFAQPEFLSLLTGFVFFVLVAIYAFFAAYADGRFIWMSYTFAVPAVAILLQND